MTDADRKAAQEFADVYAYVDYHRLIKEAFLAGIERARAEDHDQVECDWHNGWHYYEDGLHMCRCGALTRVGPK